MRFIYITGDNEIRRTTHGIEHAGFRGFRAFVARKKSWCKLIIFRFVLPHDTIPSTVVWHLKEQATYGAKQGIRRYI